jgi:flagellin
MDSLDTALEELLSSRAQIGANQSRVNTALSNLQQSREQYLQARSRILDADMAYESAELVKRQILQQSAAAVLSQANQQPALALSLLG